MITKFVALFLLAASIAACNPSSPEPVPPAPLEVYLYGDSTQAGQGTRISKYLPANYTVYNRGLPAQQSYHALDGSYTPTGHSFAHDMLTVPKGAVVVLMWGINDANISQVSPEQYIANIKALKSQAPGKIVIVESSNPIFTPHDGLLNEYAVQLRTQGFDLADQRAWLTAPGLPFELQAEVPDTLHPTEKLYDYIAVKLAGSILDTVKKYK